MPLHVKNPRRPVASRAGKRARRRTSNGASSSTLAVGVDVATALGSPVSSHF
jgi:hypothetical protein